MNSLMPASSVAKINTVAFVARYRGVFIALVSRRWRVCVALSSQSDAWAAQRCRISVAKALNRYMSLYFTHFTSLRLDQPRKSKVRGTILAVRAGFIRRDSGRSSP